MNPSPRPPTRRQPPTGPATPGDIVFALGIAALGLVLAGVLLAAGGGPSSLVRLVWGDPASPGSVATAAMHSPIALASLTPAAPSGATGIPGPDETPRTAPSSSPPLPSPSPSGPFTMNLYRAGVFVHQADKDACVAAAAQNMLNVIRLVEDGRAPDTSAKTQRALYNRIVKLTTTEDSHNGSTGPGGWAALLTKKGYPYEVRTYRTRNGAMRAAATALRATRRPVGILAWGGVHSWVLTGFTASADPATTGTFTVTTARILDPWYPWVSTRWPRSEKPNAPRDTADLAANVKPWKLASGPYPGRDGTYLLVVPLEH